MANSGHNNTEGLAYNFKVGIQSAGHTERSSDSSSVLFSSCEGIQSEIEVQFLNDGASSERAVSVRGRKMGGVITFSRGVADTSGSAKEFFTWYEAVCDSAAVLKKKLLNITLIDTENGGKTLARWEVKGAWPCRWVGPYLDIDTHSPTIERLSFAYESIRKKV